MAIAQSGSSGFNDDPLKANKIKQLKRVLGGPEIARVEVRGKKMRGLPLWKLSQQTNRFARFGALFCFYPPSSLPSGLRMD